MGFVPPSPVGDTPASTNAEGFLLLTISNATISSTASAHPLSRPINGVLSLECVTIKVSDPLERDVWLVLRVEPESSQQTSFEYPLPATQKIVLSRSQNRYSLPVVTGGELTIQLVPASTTAQKEDYETLEVLLAQYAVLQVQEEAYSGSPSSSATSFDPDGDLKGRLVLVDEDNGQVVGTLGDQFEVREDAAMKREGHEKDPVIVEIPEDETSGTGRGWSMDENGRPKVRKQIFVHPVTADDTDWVGKTAGFLGRGIVFATNTITTGMTSATNMYISRSTPATEPIVFSETTKKNVKRVHNISGKAVKVTAKTTGLIHQTVERLADKVTGVKSPPSSSSSSHHSIQAGLLPGASAATPYAHGPVPGGPAAQGWTSPYPTSSASSTRGGSLSPVPPPSYTPSPAGSSGAASPPPPPPRKRLLNRLLVSTDMLLTTVESSAHHLISHTTNSLSAAAHHKYGPDAGKAVGMMGDSVKNVGVVYIDARGVGRRALLKVAGKRIIKAKMGGKEVVFQDQGAGRGQVILNENGSQATPATSPPGATPSGQYGAPPPFPPPGHNSGVPYATYKRE